MLEIARGGAYLVTQSRAVFVGAAIGSIGTPVTGIGLSPAFICAAVIVVAGQVLLSKTVLGRYIFAIGANPEASRLSGIDPRRVLVVVFVISGLLAGLGGFFHVAYLESADPNAGIGLELSAIAAVVIGGTSLMGGRGSVDQQLPWRVDHRGAAERPRPGRGEGARQAYRDRRRHRCRRHPGHLPAAACGPARPRLNHA